MAIIFRLAISKVYIRSSGKVCGMNRCSFLSRWCPSTGNPPCWISVQQEIPRPPIWALGPG